MVVYYGNSGGAFAVGYHRRFLALFICTCLFNSAIVGYAAEGEELAAPELPPTQSIPEPPIEAVPPPDESAADKLDPASGGGEAVADQLDPASGGGEVVIEDGSNVYHIDADTIIIQTVPADQPLPDEDLEVSEEVEDSEPEVEELPQESDLEQTPVLEDVPDIMSYVLGQDGFPFYGSCWIRGQASSLGSVLLLFPMNYKDGYIGLDSSGRVFNVSNNSWTGVLYAGSSSYTVNFAAWGLPTYRVYNGSSYQNVTLYLTPEHTNLLLPDGPSPVYSISDLLPYAAVLLLGGVFLCCMRKS